MKLAPAIGLLFSGGCMALIERNVDLVLAPQAIGNLLRIPLSGLAPLAQFVFRIVD